MTRFGCCLGAQHELLEAAALRGAVLTPSPPVVPVPKSELRCAGAYFQ